MFLLKKLNSFTKIDVISKVDQYQLNRLIITVYDYYLYSSFFNIERKILYFIFESKQILCSVLMTGTKHHGKV